MASKLKSLLTITSLALAWSGPALADPVTDAKIAALETQLARLQAEIAELKIATKTAPPPAISAADPPLPTPSRAEGRSTLASSDGRVSINLRGAMQLDTARYWQSRDLPAAVSARDLSDGANFRRARIGLDGRIPGGFDYGILVEFGGSGSEDAGRLQELWVQYSALKPLRVRIGAFAPPLGLEDAASVYGSLFPERPAVADIARTLAGGDTRLGAGIIGNGDRWFASAVATGPVVQTLNAGTTSFNAPVFDEQQGYALRIAGTPLRGSDWLLHLGANAGVVAQPGDLGATAASRYAVQLRERPELRVDGTRLIDTGQIDARGARALGLEMAVQRQNLLVMGEAFDIALDRRVRAPGLTDPSFSGWYLQGSWVVTGERRRYNPATAAFDAPGVSRPFDPQKSQWGTWELAARYSTVDLNHAATSLVAADRVRGGQQGIWSLGINWFPNSAVKFMLDYYRVNLERLSAAGADIGQDYQVINLRSQLAF